jgi:hypothetical protein
MQCKYYKRTRRSPAVWRACNSEAEYSITVVELVTWEKKVLPICYECLILLGRDRDYTILEKTSLQNS